jgi:hypothetical protein
VAVVLVIALAGLTGVLASGHGQASGTRAPVRYGGLPSWLPKTTIHTGRVVQASEAHPALEIQGDTVSVELPGGRVEVTAVGPEVPEEGRFPVPATSSCTFVVTFAAASRVIAIDPAAFALIDDLGHVRHPQVMAMDGGPPPREIVPGRPVSLKLRNVLPTGDGGLAWAPLRGRPIVTWDFVVEID